MKIVFVTSRYPTENNPYNHMFVHMRCVEFLKMGHDVQVYVPSGDNTKYVYEGVAVEKIAAKEIAKKLFISEQTVTTHRKSILRKTGAHNVSTLLNFARKAQII